MYLVYCHPLDESFIAAARDRALAGLSNHEVRVTDLYAERFRPELSAWERTHHLDPPETKPEIAEYAENLADDIGLLADMPEEIARYFDWQAWSRDLAFDYSTYGNPEGGVFVFRDL